jgi:phosphate starvation-inducible protein PhoH
LRDIEGIGIIEMGHSDIIRHKLITKIITAFETQEQLDTQNKYDRGTEKS